MATREKKGRPAELTAASADPLRLYELSVQGPAEDVEFLDQVFSDHRGRSPRSLREDFCGTAALCAEWVKSKKSRTAVGIDLDDATLRWGTEHNIEPLGEVGDRVTLHRGDVMEGWRERMDVAVAFNFSYCVFRKRREILRYFRTVRRGLASDGFFMLDLHGGPDAQCEGSEEVEKDGFTYVWDQGTLDAITGRSTRRIHFRFPDGTELKNAFVYRWRIWTLPELRDLLREAGFARVEVYWQEGDAEGNNTGLFSPARRADNEEAWIAYVAAWKNR